MLSGAWSEESGFTLVELMAAMLSGIVIILATFAMIDLTIRNTNRVTDRVQAAQLGRTFLDQTVAELNSGCLVPSVSPIQPATPSGFTPATTTDATHLVFVSGMGDGQLATPTLHVLAYANNTLTDTSYPNTAGTGPTLTAGSTWTFSTTSTSARVLNNVPAFSLTYYSFRNTANATVNSLNGAAPLTVPLATTWPPTTGEVNHAYQVARVDLALTVGPDGGDVQWSGNQASVRTSLASTASFRLTPPSPSATNNPCE